MISVVIPLFNERESLPILVEEIAELMRTSGSSLEVIFVDDGSQDGSWEVIAGLARRYAWVRGIRLRRNFGKAAALSAGFKAVRSPLIVTMDADLQDDPREIAALTRALEKDLDVVSGWKKIRRDPWHKVWPSKLFNFVVSRLTGLHLHDHNCGMKCYRASVLREIRLYGELHRFIPVLAAARGFRVGEIEIKHRPRRFGHSKYGVRRFLKGFLDLLTVKFLTGYGRSPQHFLGSIGLLSFAAGLGGMFYLTIVWLVNLWTGGTPLHQRPLLTYSVAALLLGAQMMSIGFLAELITAYQSKEEDSYSIAETIGSGIIATEDVQSS